MDFSLTDKERQIQGKAREIARDLLRPRARERDATHSYPIEECKLLGEHGLMGVALPQQYGGLGLGVVEYALAVHEIAAGDPACAVTMSVTNMVGDMIERFGTPEQQAHFLPLTCRGPLPIGCFCLSEAQAGSDASALRCKAERREDGAYVLDGTKMWVTSGAYSSVALVMARTDPERKAKGITTFLLEPDKSDGWQASKAEEKMGLRGSNTAEISLEECVVPASGVLAGEGMGFSIAMTALDGGRIGIGAQSLGIARHALELAARYAKGLGRSAGQALQFRIADAATAIDAAWLMVLRAAYLRGQGRPMSRQAAMAKVFGTEQACRAVELCLESLGEAGLDAASDVERCLRDVRVTRIYEGTSEIQRLVIARELLRAA